MNTLKFKSNINCTGCLSKVSSFLDSENGIEKWNVDLDSAERILIVETSGLTSDNVKSIVQKAGFKVEELNEH